MTRVWNHRNRELLKCLFEFKSMKEATACQVTILIRKLKSLWMKIEKNSNESS